jgi:hypothetical protein
VFRCPDFFELDSLNRNTDENWALSVSNIRTLLRLLDDYFRTVLGKKIDMSSVDVQEIGKLLTIFCFPYSFFCFFFFFLSFLISSSSFDSLPFIPSNAVTL